MSIENPTLFAITMLQDYKGDLARRDFPDNDEGDHQQRVNESKRASVDAAIAGLRNAHVQQVSVPDGWRPVPISSLSNILMLIDPAPVRLPTGETMVFKNPHAAEALTRISAEVRAMLDAAPVSEAKAQEDKPSYASQMAKRWESIMPAAQPMADPCPQCIPGTVCRTPKCGRLRAQQHQPIGIDSEGGSHD